MANDNQLDTKFELSKMEHFWKKKSFFGYVARDIILKIAFYRQDVKIRLFELLPNAEQILEYNSKVMHPFQKFLIVQICLFFCTHHKEFKQQLRHY